MAMPARALTYEDGVEAGRREIATAVLIQQIAEDRPGLWCNYLPVPELGDRTPTEAWQAGEHQAVRDLIAKWYAETEATGKRMRSNPAYMKLIEERIAERRGVVR
jgi:hypothetical protein